MSEKVALELVRSSEALKALADQCRRDMQLRWPEIEFDSNVWKINTIYRTRMLDVWFTTVISNFSGKDPAYVLAFRCLMARRALEGKLKTNRAAIVAWRLLNRQTTPLATLSRHCLSEIEVTTVKAATPLSAQSILMSLSLLSAMLDELARMDVIRHVAWRPSAASKTSLQGLIARGRIATKNRRQTDVLDRQVESLSDATKAMLLMDERLTSMDRSAIAVANILMCAPSRINEPLCMTVSDRYTLEDYATRPDSDDGGQLFQAHQLLLMKGSKGASWSGKPILNFMLDLSDACWNTLVELGQRSRRIVKHYEETPNRLYLPPELEHLRGQPITKAAMWQMTNLTNREPTKRDISAVSTGVWTTLSKRRGESASSVILIDNPVTHRSDGSKNNIAKIPALMWEVAEKQLIERVHERMKSMRRVTIQNQYFGKLSDMLMLVDTERTPYLPQAWNDDMVRARLKSPPWRMRLKSEESVFKKLGLQMTKDGELVDCYIEPHDTRRWLTTKALEAGERLSDVLINKWANRLDLRQLSAYDLRTPDKKAQQVDVPVPQELESITAGLKALDEIENEYGLAVDIAIVHGDSLAITSVDAVIKATENRPVARSGNQIIILYPNRFGVCLHQHHETPCRSYTGCSEGCNEQLTVKGHLPTNEQWRRQDELNNRSIVNQLQALVAARNREIADDQLAFDAHLIMLARGMEVQEMANELVDRFHEIKDQIRDQSFRNELEAAFIARGVVARLDDPTVAAGAMIKYHNPSKHASPGYERAIEAQFGGREEMAQTQEIFHQRHPELAPMPLGLEDERHALERDDDDGRAENE